MDNSAIQPKPIFRRRRKILLIAGTVLLSWFIVHTIISIWIGLADTACKADVIVVLGNKVEENGQPSERLQARLSRAEELYKTGMADCIIVSGGVGAEGFDEAVVMREVLYKQGIPAQSIIIDDDGYNTYRTARNARRVMVARGYKSAIIVTSYYHVARTKMAFRKMGISEVYSAHARMGPELREPYALLREFVAFYYYACRGYACEPAESETGNPVP